MNKLHHLFGKLEAYTKDYLKNNKSISQANVGWHIVHSCLVIDSVCAAVLKSDPSTFVKKFSLKASLVLWFNTFPRGKAKAPSFTIPSKEFTPDTILQSIQNARESVKALSMAGENQYFTHPIFGQLHTAQTFQFLSVHTHHHLKIIRDILR